MDNNVTTKVRNWKRTQHMEDTRMTQRKRHKDGTTQHDIVNDETIRQDNTLKYTM